MKKMQFRSFELFMQSMIIIPKLQERNISTFLNNRPSLRRNDEYNSFAVLEAKLICSNNDYAIPAVPYENRACLFKIDQPSVGPINRKEFVV